MPSGQCLCGAIRISYSTAPAATMLCHCTDCQRITGSTYSSNIIFPTAELLLDAGTPKTYAKTANTGKTITSYFCGDCGGTLWRETPTFEGLKIVKAGMFASEHEAERERLWEEAKPKLELFGREKVSWVGKIEGSKRLVEQEGL